jgi:rhamnogalacturonyl hydrolase YesR
MFTRIRTIKRLLVLALGIAGGWMFSSFAAVAAAPSAETFASFTDDGGWCWFSDPRAISRDGKTFTGWVTSDGSIEAAELDERTGQISSFTLHRKFERDDHDAPSFLFLPDGRLMAFYSKHIGNPNPQLRARVTTQPGSIAAWEPEVTLPLVDNSGGDAGITYNNPFMLSDEPNAIYLFWRGLSFKPTMSTSLDGGRTWSAARPVFSRAGLPEGNRPYAKYASNGKDRIHFLFTDGHPRNEPSNNVYYMCYRAGAFYKADGTRICGVNELPIRPEQADLVYDATKTGARAWIWDIAADAQDRPVIVYTRLPEETDHRYHYTRWDGRQWVDTELCAGGGWFPQTPPGTLEREPHYSSGLTLDPADPSIVYLTRPVKGVRELEKWTTRDGGWTWKSEAVTSGSEHDNVRPYVIMNHSPDGPTVLWENVSGHYTHYTDYRCAIKLDRLAKKRAPLSAALKPQAVLEAMERVGDWQLANPSRHKPTDWTQGAGYAGMMALAAIAGDSKYREAMRAMGEENEWNLGRRALHADDQVVGQAYAELYLQYRAPEMIAPMRRELDKVVAHLQEPQSLEFKGEGVGGLWTWCDSLFMAPPALVRLYAATGDRRYRDCAVTNWWRTSDFLYDKEVHLFFRDSTFFERRETNGQKIFWSRGNGWVMAGLVRVLEFLPNNDPDRARFEQQFKAMAAAILQCQQPDGLWRASLLDPAEYPLKESSGSGFYAYALAWGVNQGLLDRKQYEPAVRRAWAALIRCVAPDGKLTHVQPIGTDPKKFAADATEVYGVGAFLLAGSEVYRLALVEHASPLRIRVSNATAQFHEAQRVTLPVATLPRNPVVMDALTSRVVDSRIAGQELRFEADLAPGDSRDYLVFPRSALPACPLPAVKLPGR